MATTAFLSLSPGLLNRGPGGPASLGAGFLYCILSPTDCTCCAPSYIIVRRPPSCGRHKSHSFNPSTVKVIFWYSSTGCTCYLYICVSYFDSPVGSEVNIQHLKSRKFLYKSERFSVKSILNFTDFDKPWNHWIKIIRFHIHSCSKYYNQMVSQGNCHNDALQKRENNGSLTSCCNDFSILLLDSCMEIH